MSNLFVQRSTNYSIKVGVVNPVCTLQEKTKSINIRIYKPKYKFKSPKRRRTSMNREKRKIVWTNKPQQNLYIGENPKKGAQTILQFSAIAPKSENKEENEARIITGFGGINLEFHEGCFWISQNFIIPSAFSDCVPWTRMEKSILVPAFRICGSLPRF